MAAHPFQPIISGAKERKSSGWGHRVEATVRQPCYVEHPTAARVAASKENDVSRDKRLTHDEPFELGLRDVQRRGQRRPVAGADTSLAVLPVRNGVR